MRARRVIAGLERSLDRLARAIAPASAAAMLTWPAAAAARAPADVAGATAVESVPSAGPVRVELGLYAGAFMPDEAHEFYDPSDAVQQPLDEVGPELGVRLAFFPGRFGGIEGEAELLPMSTESGQSVLLFGARAHVILQVPARVTPFLLFGFGTMGVRSQKDELATDADKIGHVGLGLKIRLSRRIALRVEGRALRAPKAGVDTGTTHYAALLGISFAAGESGERLGRVAPPRVPVAEPPVRPVPPATASVTTSADGDRDLIDDAADRCPSEPGPASNRGCPDADRDDDGVADPLDNCPDEAGSAAKQGCLAPQLVVITPTRLRLLVPVTFATDRWAIRQRFLPVLDNVAAVLMSHPELARIRIAGHTDDRGDTPQNLLLSHQRAVVVAQYLVGRGVAAERLQPVGYGEEQPIEPNTGAAGRAANRRVEIEIAPPSPR